MWERVWAFIEEKNLLPDHSTVVIGVSGGADSMSLLHYLDSLKNTKKLKLIVAHMDHMFRGQESQEDLHFVREQCLERGLIFEGEQIDVSRYQREHKLSAQVAARECRYVFYQRVMGKYEADILALGHHADDQIETIVMRLGRGSSMTGYAGILPKRDFGKGTIVRPLLSVTKEEIFAYLKDNGVLYRHDSSNDKDAYRRNRLRHQVLPLLKEEFPNLHLKFQSFSEQMQEDETFLQALTEKEWNKVVKSETETTIVLARKPLLLMAKPLQRRGVQLILNYLYNNEIPPSLSSIHIDNLLSLLESEHPSGKLDFPSGLQVFRSYDECTLTFDTSEAIAYKYEFFAPGEVKLPSGTVIKGEIWTHYKKSDLKNNQAAIDLSKLTLPLIIRTRKEGDRVRLKGSKGSKKLTRIFIDEKIARTMRDAWPLITDAKSEILWVPMLTRSTFEATEETMGPVLVLTCMMSQKVWEATKK